MKNKGLIITLIILLSIIILFLSLKFTNANYLIEILIFCNIPILLAYLKKQPKVALILSFITLYYSFYIYKININLMIIKYICYYIIYLLSRLKHLQDSKYIQVQSAFFKNSLRTVSESISGSTWPQ